MIQSISYNLTDEESTLLKVSVKKFKERSFFESLSIRSLIDPGASEYKLNLHDFPKTKEGEIQKIWYKLLHIISAFCNHIDFKALIHKNIEWMTSGAYKYNYYEKCVKRALAEYIIFLRTGFTDYGLKCELVENMKIDDMVNLLNDELCLRTSFYKNKNKEFLANARNSLFFIITLLRRYMFLVQVQLYQKLFLLPLLEVRHFLLM